MTSLFLRIFIQTHIRTYTHKHSILEIINGNVQDKEYFGLHTTGWTGFTFQV